MDKNPVFLRRKSDIYTGDIQSMLDENQWELSALTAISPVDGRYRERVATVGRYFSERALMYYRLRVEIKYLIAFCAVTQTIKLPEAEKNTLRGIYRQFSEQDALRVKAIEETTNHDVKAIEYFLRQKISELNLNLDLVPYIHFGLTSQDLNNTAIPMALKEFINEQLTPAYRRIIKALQQEDERSRKLPMLARTHGQPAAPTTLGKELRVFTERLTAAVQTLKSLPFPAKFGGATGNFNAHRCAFPLIDWPSFADEFVNETLGLARSQTTTQIDHYDGLAAFFDAIRRANVILIDACRDLWTYVSIDYFKLKIKDTEVGSSVMPHKVNPIDFENAEGNFAYANAIFDFLSNKLPVSRLQRDLTDSTVLRNLGVPLAHTLVALDSFTRGMQKITVNPEAIARDLSVHWNVLSEAVQTVLRREGYPDAYERLKAATRGAGLMDEAGYRALLDNLALPDEVHAELLRLTPEAYIGYAAE